MIVPDTWAEEFGEEKTIDTSIEAVDELLHTYNASAIPQNVIDRWEVMQEREPGFYPDVERDLAETVKIYNDNPELLKKEYPRHYALLIKLLGL